MARVDILLFACLAAAMVAVTSGFPRPQTADEVGADEIESDYDDTTTASTTARAKVHPRPTTAASSKTTTVKPALKPISIVGQQQPGIERPIVSSTPILRTAQAASDPSGSSAAAENKDEPKSIVDPALFNDDGSQGTTDSADENVGKVQKEPIFPIRNPRPSSTTTTTTDEPKNEVGSSTSSLLLNHRLDPAPAVVAAGSQKKPALAARPPTDEASPQRGSLDVALSAPELKQPSPGSQQLAAGLQPLGNAAVSTDQWIGIPTKFADPDSNAGGFDAQSDLPEPDVPAGGNQPAAGIIGGQKLPFNPFGAGTPNSSQQQKRPGSVNASRPAPTPAGVDLPNTRPVGEPASEAAAASDPAAADEEASPVPPVPGPRPSWQPQHQLPHQLPRVQQAAGNTNRQLPSGAVVATRQPLDVSLLGPLNIAGATRQQQQQQSLARPAFRPLSNAPQQAQQDDVRRQGGGPGPAGTYLWPTNSRPAAAAAGGIPVEEAEYYDDDDDYEQSEDGGGRRRGGGGEDSEEDGGAHAHGHHGRGRGGDGNRGGHRHENHD